MNFDSGSTRSTVLTFRGLLGDPGTIASTCELSKVHDVDSLRARISLVNGSEEKLPHKVPEQPVEGLDSPLAAFDPAA